MIIISIVPRCIMVISAVVMQLQSQKLERSLKRTVHKILLDNEIDQNSLHSIGLLLEDLKLVQKFNFEKAVH